MANFYTRNGIKQRTSAPFYPSTNGQAEMMVGETKRALTKLTDGSIECRLARFLFKQHTTVSTSTGKTPAELLFGRRLTTPLDWMHPENDSSSHEIPQVLPRSHDFEPDRVHRRHVDHIKPRLLKSDHVATWETAKASLLNFPLDMQHTPQVTQSHGHSTQEGQSAESNESLRPQSQTPGDLPPQQESSSKDHQPPEPAGLSEQAEHNSEEVNQPANLSSQEQTRNDSTAQSAQKRGRFGREVKTPKRYKDFHLN
ncbi:uncharacterized protein LOC135375630 [Ornithodoros turicata]|uniref:uncharacterized protein LOC135375630 n=1 Tax=Ornithodoros turicata TaxID=34597 RepID=UPI00313A2114